MAAIRLSKHIEYQNADTSHKLETGLTLHHSQLSLHGTRSKGMPISALMMTSLIVILATIPLANNERGHSLLKY